jgi:hypothetical protein
MLINESDTNVTTGTVAERDRDNHKEWEKHILVLEAADDVFEQEDFDKLPKGHQFVRGRFEAKGRVRAERLPGGEEDPERKANLNYGGRIIVGRRRGGGGRLRA